MASHKNGRGRRGRKRGRNNPPGRAPSSPVTSVTTAQARASNKHPAFRSLINLFEEVGLPVASSDNESWELDFAAFCRSAMRDLGLLVRDRSVDVDVDLLRVCHRTMEEYRIENDGPRLPGSTRLREPQKTNLATMCWLVSLHILCVTHRLWSTTGPGEGGREGPSFVASRSEPLRRSLLVVSEADVADYDHVTVEVALNAMMRYLRDVTEPFGDLVAYVRALEMRIAVLAIFPGTRETFNRVLDRARAGSTGGGSRRAYRVSMPALVRYAGFFSSVRTRWARHRTVCELEAEEEGQEGGGARRFPARDERAFGAFVAVIVGKASVVSTPEYLQGINSTLTFAEYDPAAEAILAYSNVQASNSKNLQREIVPWPFFRAMNDVVIHDNMEATIQGRRNVAEVMDMAHPVFGRTWRNDMVTIKYVSSLFENSFLCKRKLDWAGFYVFTERSPFPGPVARNDPLVVQCMGRYDVVYGDRARRTRDAMEAAFLWCHIVWADPRYNGTISGVQLRAEIFERVFSRGRHGGRHARATSSSSSPQSPSPSPVDDYY